MAVMLSSLFEVQNTNFSQEPSNGITPAEPGALRCEPLEAANRGR